MRTIIKNGIRLETQTMSLHECDSLIIEDGMIIAIDDKSSTKADIEIDAKGKFLLPGFIDAHVHFRLATLNFAKLASWSEVQFGIAMASLSEQTLQRGFTTTRDTGGDLSGLMRAIRDKQAIGPRIVQSNRMISQTGGHGDVEGGPRPVPDCACQMRHTAMGIVADGPDAVRKAARHVLREGADFLKIHVSGGVASPSDPLECTQYTGQEIAAAVQEANNRKTYVTAHAYTSEAIAMAVKHGVKCIEHGNLMDETTAQLLIDNQVTLVPTLVTYQAMHDLGPKLGLPKRNLEKNKAILEAGLRSLELANNAGVNIGWGTDLIGETQSMQAQEFAIRAQVQTAKEILNAMYIVNPQLLKLEDKIGQLKPGFAGDVVLTATNPLDNIAGLASDDGIVVIQAGKVVK